jgi:WD40 repeat protein
MQSLIGVEEEIKTLAFSPTGAYLAVASTSKALTVWDWETGTKKLTRR